MIYRAISGFILLFFIFGSCGNMFQSDPKLFLLDYQYLNEIKTRISEKSPIHLPAYSRLCKEAENALLKNYSFYISGQNLLLNSTTRTNHAGEEKPFVETGSSEDHPKQLEGTYLTTYKDARISNDQHYLEMTTDISTLTLAWFFSKDERYAIKASEMIENWFINSKKAIINNDNQDNQFLHEMQYNAISLFNTRKYIDVIDAIALLETGVSWNKRDTGKIKRWFSDYLQWLLMSEAGLDEKSQINFHGTWYDAQLAGCALFADRKDIARKAINYSLVKRIPGQFDGKGFQQHELSSSQSYNYSCINIEGHLLIGKIAGYIGIDYWNDPIMPIITIQAACDYLFSFIGKEEQWPYPQSEPVELGRMVKLVIESEKIFNNPDYKKYLEILKHDIKSNSRLIIIN